MGLTPDTKVRLIALGALFLLMGMVAVTRGNAVTPREPTLADYAQAADAARTRFAERFTGELLGRRDPDRARLLREFLDGHVARIRSQSADPRVRDAKLGVTARSAARTGARILGWPGPNAQ